MDSLIIKQQVPSADDYHRLRKAVNWHALSNERAQPGLKNSLYAVSVYDGEQLVAMGRIVGDGHIYFYLQDLMVRPDYQHHGLGSKIMESLMQYIDEHAPVKSGAYVGLMMAPGLHDFYEKFGFKDLPKDSPAMGMWRNGH